MMSLPVFRRLAFCKLTILPGSIKRGRRISWNSLHRRVLSSSETSMSTVESRNDRGGKKLSLSSDGPIAGAFSKEAATAPVDEPVVSRWWAVPPASFVHLSIGSVYCYSMWTPGMTHAVGVIAASSVDWTQSAVIPVFSASAVILGLTTSTLGSWVEKVGPRQAALVGSALWSSALLTTAAGVHFHSLPTLYAGWGLLGGMGWGLMYLSPVTAVMKWFPDRRGLATVRNYILTLGEINGGCLT